MAVLLQRNYSFDASTPESLDEALAPADVILRGRLSDVVDGRLEYIDTDSETGEPIELAYANYEVTVGDILEGRLPDPGVLSFEIPRPTDVPVKQYRESAPIGADVLIIADVLDVDAVQANVEVGESNGLDQLGPLGRNLSTVLPWGLIVEDPASGETTVPLLDDRALADVVSSIGLRAATIDDLAAIIRQR